MLLKARNVSSFPASDGLGERRSGLLVVGRRSTVGASAASRSGQVVDARRCSHLRLKLEVNVDEA